MKYLFILIILLVFSSCNVEETMQQRIDEANYCNQDSECTVITGRCPFGCWIPLHVSEVKGIKAQLDVYHSNCVYDCVAINTSKVSCEENKCVLPELVEQQ